MYIPSILCRFKILMSFDMFCPCYPLDFANFRGLGHGLVLGGPSFDSAQIRPDFVAQVATLRTLGGICSFISRYFIPLSIR